MKLSEVISFFTLAGISEPFIIKKQFDYSHSFHQANFPFWSVQATRRKLINWFWYRAIAKHFAFLLSGSVLIELFLNGQEFFSASLFISLLFFSFFSFLVLLLFIYLPTFQSHFLPILESYSEFYSGKQLEGLQKCKKQQYSVMTLMLIQYCYTTLSGIETSLLAEPFSDLLVRQYGVSQKMVDAALRTFLLNQWDHSKRRKQTELRESFEEAIDYFEAFDAKSAVKILNQLKQKVCSCNH